MSQDDELSRRDFLSWVAAAAALLALPGCEPATPQASAPARRSRPVGAYASPVVGNVSEGAYYVYSDPPPGVNPSSITVPHPGYGQPTIVQAAYTAPAQPTYRVQQTRPGAPRQARIVQSRGKVTAVSRNSWGATAAVPAKMKMMNGVKRITIHHEGSAKPNNDTAPTQVAATLRLIQSQHRKRMGAGDIGYHFIIDRTGVIWQGRDWNYQGAHTSGANSNNLGVMLLGNFEIQQPTAQQIQSLNALVASLVRKYGLNPATDIFGHSDFCNTACPGKHLKGQVQMLRRLR
ncbi:MAG: peptidoglycan recognition protein family protein [Planctomycetaceae bacterium]|nr:peptidoglycan recognition protein family protein [Planctomycetaceae bacterium]